MADIRLGQTANGKWKVSLTHDNSNVPSGLSVPVTLKYQNNASTMVTLYVKRGQTVSQETEWATPIGTAIDTNQISFSGEATYEGKTYRIRSISWEVIPAGDEPKITITYTGSQVGADAGTTRAFTITAVNATVTGYTVDNGATVTDSGTTFVEISYPANDSQTSTKTYTVTAKGKDDSNNLVQGSTQFTQSKKTTPTQYSLDFVDETDLECYVDVPCEGLATHAVRIATTLPSSSWGATSNKSWIHVTERVSDILIDVDASSEGARNGVVTITGTGVNSLTVPVNQVDCSTPGVPVIRVSDLEIVRDDLGSVPCEGYPSPGYEITVNVTPYHEWVITEDTGDGWVHVSNTENKAYIIVDENDNGVRDTTLNISLVDQNLGADAVSIYLEQDTCSESPHYLNLANGSDLHRFENIPCLGLASPGYDIEINSDVAWRARLSDIDDEYWLHVSYGDGKVTVYIDQNTDPYSGEGGDSRTSSFVIEAINPSLSLQPIIINVSQGSCDDLINVEDKSAFVFTCDGPDHYTREITAWPDVEWHIEPDFREYQDVDWFSVSPTSGYGNGSFTVTILGDNYDNGPRGSGYLVFSTGSTKTVLDWDINVKQEPTPFLELTGTTAHIPSNGGEVTIVVQTNKDITVDKNVSWIKDVEIGNNIRQVGGTAYTEVTFTVEENTSTDSGRNGVLTITSTYDGPCGPLGSKTITVSQDPAESSSATFIHVRKTTEPITQLHQSIEFGIDEAAASTTEMEFVVHCNGMCRVSGITSNTGDENDITVYMMNGSIELDVTNGEPFDLIGSSVFKAVYGDPYSRERNFKITFVVDDPGIIVESDEKATVEIQQEREYAIGVTEVYINSAAPQYTPWEGNCCTSNITPLVAQICGETIYNSGRRGASEQICTFLKTDPNNNQRTGIDSDILTLEVLNNPSTMPKWCYIRPDELQESGGGAYHPDCDKPFGLEITPNTGTTRTDDPWAAGFVREIQMRLSYHDDDNSKVYDFTIRVPYCNPAEPGEQDVCIIDGGDCSEEITINPGVGTIVEVQLSGLTVGETKLHFDGSDGLTDSIVSNFMVNGEPVDVTDGNNSWTADTANPVISFTRLYNGEFSVIIDCDRTGYSQKTLVVWLDEWES